MQVEVEEGNKMKKQESNLKGPIRCSKSQNLRVVTRAQMALGQGIGEVAEPECQHTTRSATKL